MVKKNESLDESNIVEKKILSPRLDNQIDGNKTIYYIIYKESLNVINNNIDMKKFIEMKIQKIKIIPFISIILIIQKKKAIRINI